MHNIFVALELRKMLKLADSFKMGLLANQKSPGSHPTISKSYNENVNGKKVMLEHLEIKMVRGHKLVDEDG